jgi:phosphate-selective porin OprO and OprP
MSRSFSSLLNALLLAVAVSSPGEAGDRLLSPPPAPTPSAVSADSSENQRSVPLFLNEGDEMVVISRSELRRMVAELWEEQSALSTATDAAQDEEISRLEQNWWWLQDQSAQEQFPTVQLHGVFQADAGWFHQDDASLEQYGRIQDGAGFRRFRLSANGSVVENMNYFAQVDFAFFGRPTIMDLWLEQANIPWIGTIRVGQWKEPFSLEVVSSFRYTTFMERSVLFQPFTPFRHIGAGFYNYADDLSATWSASVFRSGQDQFGNSISTKRGWGTAERITWLPYWETDGADYLHLGLGHFFNAPPNGVVNFRTIPEMFIGQHGAGPVGTSAQAVPGELNGTPFFVATGNIAVGSYNVLGTELLWVRGPFSLQSEVMVNFVDQAVRADVVLPGFYVQAGYFLTGEHRPYDRKAGAIDRVIPYRDLRDGNGWGRLGDRRETLLPRSGRRQAAGHV